VIDPTIGIKSYFLENYLRSSHVLKKMVENKLSFGEGAFINRPPMFVRVNYQFGKSK